MGLDVAHVNNRRRSHGSTDDHTYSAIGGRCDDTVQNGRITLKPKSEGQLLLRNAFETFLADAGLTKSACILNDQA